MDHCLARLPCLLCVFAAALAGCSHGPPAAVAPPEPLVTVSRPIVREIADYEDYTGRTDAVSTVDVRARVSGYLVKVNFADGDVVKQGDLLYQIDPRPFQADLDQAKGQVERLEAQKKLFAIQVERYRRLAEKGAGSRQDYDQYVAQQAENVGGLKAAQAQVDRAVLNLEFTRITTPTTGQISRTLLTTGNLVAADNTLLTTIVTIDPMYAYFNIEEITLLRVRKLMREGVIKARGSHEVEVQMGLADDQDRKFPLRGTIDFVNNAVDPQTGTILVRGVFPNPHQLPQRPPLLTPGLFVRVRLPMGLPHRAMLITERAIGTDQGQKFVYVVDESNKVSYRRVKLGLMFDGLQAVEEGLNPGERVVVNGLQRVRPGAQVRVEQVDMAGLAGIRGGDSPKGDSPVFAEQKPGQSPGQEPGQSPGTGGPRS